MKHGKQFTERKGKMEKNESEVLQPPRKNQQTREEDFSGRGEGNWNRMGGKYFHLKDFIKHGKDNETGCPSRPWDGLPSSEILSAKEVHLTDGKEGREWVQGGVREDGRYGL